MTSSWSRYIYINRYTDAPKPVYDKLLDLIKDRAILIEGDIGEVLEDLKGEMK